MDLPKTVADAVAGNNADMVMTVGGSSAGSEDYALPPRIWERCWSTG
jgi:molybdopterin biosynthesis enzyme